MIIAIEEGAAEAGEVLITSLDMNTAMEYLQEMAEELSDRGWESGHIVYLVDTIENSLSTIRFVRPEPYFESTSIMVKK